VDPQNLDWLEADPHPLDWNGPCGRPFAAFRPETLNRPIIENLERVVARHAERVAVSDSHSSLSFGEFWERVCGLGQTVGAQTEPGELIAVLLPSCSRSPLAMLACLARTISTPIHTWPSAAWTALARILERVRDHLAQRQTGGLPVPEFLRSAPASVLKVGVNGLVASTRYRPGFYAGEVTLFTPTLHDPTLPSPQAIWHRHALALSVVPLVGTHLSMVSAANAETAAASLSRALGTSGFKRQALVRRPRPVHLHADLEGQDHARELLHPLSIHDNQLGA
jgi:hypothetical protein